MIKSDLIHHITNELPHLSHDKVKRLVNHLIQTMSEALTEERSIEIRGFGSFSTHHYGQHQAHNPKTGEKILVTKQKRPRFKPSKLLIKKLNETT